MKCLHCEGKFKTSEMEPLSSGDPSNCCRSCWRAYRERAASALIQLERKWRRDRAKEDAAHAGTETEDKSSRQRWAKRKPRPSPAPGQDSLMIN